MEIFQKTTCPKGYSKEVRIIIAVFIVNGASSYEGGRTSRLRTIILINIQPCFILVIEPM